MSVEAVARQTSKEPRTRSREKEAKAPAQVTPMKARVTNREVSHWKCAFAL